VAGGAWLVTVVGLCAAGAGVANALVAQGRLLLGFARAGQAPALPARVEARRGVPASAALVVAVLASAVALVADATGGLGTLVTLVNVGALTAFAALHVGVAVRFVVRGGSRRPAHLLVPVLGIATITAVVVSSADVARSLGAVWFALAAAVSVVCLLRRRSGATSEDVPQVADGGG
jgi:amino acid transporter